MGVEKHFGAISGSNSFSLFSPPFVLGLTSVTAPSVHLSPDFSFRKLFYLSKNSENFKKPIFNPGWLRMGRTRYHKCFACQNLHFPLQLEKIQLHLRFSALFFSCWLFLLLNSSRLLEGREDPIFNRSFGFERVLTKSILLVWETKGSMNQFTIFWLYTCTLLAPFDPISFTWFPSNIYSFPVFLVISSVRLPICVGISSNVKTRHILLDISHT